MTNLVKLHGTPPVLKRAKKTKLPVPPPKHPEASAVNPDLPPFLDRKLNGIKDNPPVAVAAPGEALKAGAEQSMQDRQAALRQEQAEAKKAKARGRIEKLKAKQTGAAKAMPLSGKAALAAIAKAAVDNGHKVQKLPPGPGLRAAPENAPVKPAKAPAKPAGKAKPAKAAPKAPAKPAKKDNGGPSKSDIARKLLARPNGVTRKELTQATDWPSLNVARLVHISGKKLVKKDGRFYMK